MKTPYSIQQRFRRGFTLPEVIVALAITALGLVSLLGLIPQSLDTLRKAGQVSAEAQIAQQIFATVSMSDWQDTKGKDQLAASYQGRRYYFDELAVPLEQPDPAFGPAYVAEVTIAPSDIALPQGNSQSTTPDPLLRRVTVKVATSASIDFDFSKADARAYRTYASVVTRTGK